MISKGSIRLTDSKALMPVVVTLQWIRPQVPTRSMWIRSGANLLLGYSPALMKMQEMVLRKRFAEAKELMDGRRWWDEHGLSWDGKRWDLGSGFRSREQAQPRTKGINGEGQKEQARQLFFKGDCKVSTMEFLSTCKNVYNNLRVSGGYNARLSRRKTLPSP